MLNEYKGRIGYLDLETQYLFEEIDLNWRKYNYKEKKILEQKLFPELKVALTGVLIKDYEQKNKIYYYYEESNINDLIKDLENVDKIIGHNLIEFDYKVLESYLPREEIKFILSKTFDMWLYFSKEIDQWIGLDDLAKNNINKSKSDDPLLIPKLWREGKINRVKSYLNQELDITSELFEFGIENGYFKYIHKDYGRIIGVRETKFNWNTILRIK